ncbi:protein CHROMATIN REMODELING 24 isoform X4 [Setaria italica]|uniref:protein CHROMATIN REMODELING 24 isoform X4 n=1 Tax=Setaria italica TaxID=4555 RepID=UPI000BE538E7|nr:protein CHROMATIN REMODELING 24 isoform X4 [Setaria italica]
MQWSELLLEAIDRGQGNSVRRLAKRLLESFDHEVWKKYKNSCKISFILDLVNELFEEEKAEKKKDLGMRKNKNLKILIFSQFISMLDRIEIALKAIGKEGDTIRIDGSMERTERDQKIKKFSSQVEDAPKIFLLSARVGGEGLNLTAATRVIIVDPSWNIRVFRIGQKEDVTVYRLVTCMTIEEDIYKTQILKGNLARAILEGKVCSPLVELEDRKFIRLPECGFNSSKTQQLLETLMGDILEMRSRHQRFLQKHHLVAGLTNQEVISSHEEISLIDLPLGESSDEEASSSEERHATKASKGAKSYKQ